jgi:hypothetical protein
MSIPFHAKGKETYWSLCVSVVKVFSMDVYKIFAFLASVPLRGPGRRLRPPVGTQVDPKEKNVRNRRH